VDVIINGKGFQVGEGTIRTVRDNLNLSERWCAFVYLYFKYAPTHRQHCLHPKSKFLAFIYFRAGNTNRSSPLNWENALSVVIIWNPERMAKAAK
jgi:hypothetical protein